MTRLSLIAYVTVPLNEIAAALAPGNDGPPRSDPRTANTSRSHACAAKLSSSEEPVRPPASRPAACDAPRPTTERGAGLLTGQGFNGERPERPDLAEGIEWRRGCAFDRTERFSWSMHHAKSPSPKLSTGRMVIVHPSKSCQLNRCQTAVARASQISGKSRFVKILELCNVCFRIV